MNRIVVFALSLLSASHVAAGPAEDEAAFAQARGSAIALLRQGKLPESRQSIASALSVRGFSGSVAAGRQWVRVAFHLNARGEKELSRQAANEALLLANQAASVAGVSSERSSFLLNAGLVCERILRNPTLAKAYYDAAVIAQPNSKDAREKQQNVDAKNKRRALGRNPGL